MLFTGCSLQNKQRWDWGHPCSPAAPSTEPCPWPRRVVQPLAHMTAAPCTQALGHLSSEGLLRDLAQLPGCWGKGTRGSWIIQEWGGSLCSPGHCEGRPRERHIEDTPTDPVDSERAKPGTPTSRWPSLDARRSHMHTQVGSRSRRGSLMCPWIKAHAHTHTRTHAQTHPRDE